MLSLSPLFKSRAQTPSLASQSSIAGTISSVATSTPSDNASPAGSSAVNALMFSLQHLGKAPLPGIEVSTSVLLEIINRIQVSQENITQDTCKNMRAVEKGCKQLAKRMESLWYLVNNMGEIDEGEILAGPLIDELQALTSDLESALRQNKVVAFFNSDDDTSSVESHNQSLTDIITDLTATLATATPRSAGQIRKDIDEAVKQLHANGHYAPGGLFNRFSNNKIQHIGGKFSADNKVYGTQVSILFEIHGNEIGSIGGDAFSGNVASPFAP